MRISQNKKTVAPKAATQKQAPVPAKSTPTETQKATGWGPKSNESSSSAKSSVLETLFRRKNGLNPLKGSEDHDRRHVMFGKSTSRKSETTLNSAEKTILKTLAEKGDKGFPKELKQTKTLQHEFDGFHKEQTSQSKSFRKKQTTAVNDILHKLDSQGNNIGAVNSELKKHFQKEGLRSFSDNDAQRFDRVADRALSKDPKNFATNYKREALAELSRQTKPLTREESLSDFRSMVSTVETLSSKTGKSPRELLRGSSEIDYSTAASPSADLKKALDGVR